MSKKLILNYHWFAFPEDVERIVQVCRDRGFEIDPTTAEQAWLQYSDSMCAGWLTLPDDDNHVFDDIFSLLSVVDG